MNSAEQWIEHLNLSLHPEGGYYKEVYRSAEELFPKNNKNIRNLATSIYFLLDAGQVSHFHSIKSDEIWYHHAGASLNIHCILPDGSHCIKKLGNNISKDEFPQQIVSTGSIFGAENNSDTFSLVSCMVAPGFDFSDFTLFTTSKLSQLFPQHNSIIKKLTKEYYSNE